MSTMKIQKGDTVMVIAGKDRGKTGKVTRALPKEDQVVVEGVNVKKRHRRPQQAGQHGQIVEKAMPVHVSNVQIVDPKNGEPTRVGVQRQADGSRVRIAKKSGTAIDG